MPIFKIQSLRQTRCLFLLKEPSHFDVSNLPFNLILILIAVVTQHMSDNLPGSSPPWAFCFFFSHLHIRNQFYILSKILKVPIDPIQL